MPPGVERLSATLQEFFNHRSHRRMVNRAQSVAHDSSAHASVGVLRHERHDLLGISENWDIRIVTRDNDLSLSFGRSKSRNDVFVDEPVVQVILRLVNYQWPIAAAHEQEQQRSGLLSSRELVEAPPSGRLFGRDIQLQVRADWEFDFFNQHERLS
jgi:hypothetical protein